MLCASGPMGGFSAVLWGDLRPRSERSALAVCGERLLQLSGVTDGNSGWACGKRGRRGREQRLGGRGQVWR